jgi:aromatic ring hydroxylase
MGLRTSDQYRKALQDGREVYYRGRRVPDVTEQPELRVAIDHAAIDFDLAHDQANHELMVAKDADTGHDISAYYRIPRSTEDLLARSKLIETVTAAGGTMVTLIKEIGSDALFALQRVLGGEELERARRFYRHCADNDLAVCVGQTDAKGDRSKGPSEQDDPDMYMRVVSTSSDGIVVRGAKCHTSVSVNADEIIVLPTRAMSATDADYAVSFAVPLNTKGLKLFVSSYAGGERNGFEFPLSSKHKMLETLTVFDDVFVPWERVFMCRQPEKAGQLALTFVEYHRFTAVSYKLPLVDALVGAAAVIAEMNGVIKAGHIRDKLTHLIIYAETVRALTEMAAIRARVGAHAIAYPDPMTTNMAKFTFATQYHHAIELVQDCSGGLLVTGPGGEDWDDPDIRAVLEKYYAAVAPAADRLRMLHMISDLTARDFGGYHAVLAVHAEGSIEAEKMQILRSYDAARTMRYARKIAGLS